jgi:16S rRNA (cytidine1402-2'-O)-methyltransferase
MNVTNRKDLPAGLWVVATPIGNLDDLTPRALRALESADQILCEDTRRTAHLFSAVGLPLDPGRLARFDAHSDLSTVARWIHFLSSGKSVALVTDAGTPSVSDPGSALVAAAHAEGIRVTPVPGVSAVSTFLSVAGWVGNTFTFGGFFPRKGSEQSRLLSAVHHSSLSQIWIWFESPHRIQDALLGVEHFSRQNQIELKVVAAKELTKLHEKIFSGTALSVYTAVEKEITSEGALGEWCFGVEFPKSKSEAEDQVGTDSQGSAAWVLALACLIEEGVSPSRAAKRVSQTFNVPKNQAYERAIHLSAKN